MAIVADLAVPGTPPDVRYSSVTRRLTTVYNSATPAFPGEIVMDATLQQLYVANGLTTTSWTPITAIV